jgi:NTE family protein
MADRSWMSLRRRQDLRPGHAAPDGAADGGNNDRRGIAFVLGGGGVLGSHEVGMLRALVEAGIHPDLVIGTSVGALNGAFFAASPDADAVERLTKVWEAAGASDVFGGSILGRLSRLAKSRTHVHDSEPLRRLLLDLLQVELIEDLAVPFQCVAASIERAAGHWFTSGPIVPAVMASAAVPGLLPAVEIDGEHFVDGGIVDSIPVGRAVALGARTVYVLQVGRIERPLTAPTRPWEVGLVAFEIARRHRFSEAMASLPAGVAVHVLPTGTDEATSRYSDLSQQLRYRNFSRVQEMIDRAFEASAAYLATAAATPPARGDQDRHVAGG